MPVPQYGAGLRRTAVPAWALSDADHTRLDDDFACCVAMLGRFAHRTYAPATQESRLAGAGAGLTDND